MPAARAPQTSQLQQPKDDKTSIIGRKKQQRETITLTDSADVGVNMLGHRFMVNLHPQGTGVGLNLHILRHGERNKMTCLYWKPYHQGSNEKRQDNNLSWLLAAYLPQIRAAGKTSGQGQWGSRDSSTAGPSMGPWDDARLGPSGVYRPLPGLASALGCV